jgi:hypothetical protein
MLFEAPAASSQRDTTANASGDKPPGAFLFWLRWLEQQIVPGDTEKLECRENKQGIEHLLSPCPKPNLLAGVQLASVQLASVQRVTRLRYPDSCLSRLHSQYASIPPDRLSASAPSMPPPRCNGLLRRLGNLAVVTRQITRSAISLRPPGRLGEKVAVYEPDRSEELLSQSSPRNSPCQGEQSLPADTSFRRRFLLGSDHNMRSVDHSVP